MPSSDDPMLYPNAGASEDAVTGVSRRQLVTGSVVLGTAATAGCVASGSPQRENLTDRPTVFVFNTGDGSVSIVDAESDEVIGSRAIGVTASFPSNQYSRVLTDDPEDSLWLNVGRGVRALAVGSLSEQAAVDTGSGANWLEQTPDGEHVVVSAREPAHRQVRLDADPSSETFGEVTGDIDRSDEDGRGDRDGPGPCDVTIHPNGRYAYVPDLFGDTLTVLDVESFEIANQVSVSPIGDGPAAPWMGTASWDGQTLLVEHNEGETGSESLWDLRNPAEPTEIARLTAADGLGHRPLTSEIGPDSETGYVFTPGTEDVTVVDLTAGEVTDRIDLGGESFVGTWDPARTRLYVPVQTNDEVAVIDHERGEVTTTLDVGPEPYGATAATVRPTGNGTSDVTTTLRRLGVLSEPPETTYCIGRCSCGHEL